MIGKLFLGATEWGQLSMSEAPITATAPHGKMSNQYPLRDRAGQRHHRKPLTDGPHACNTGHAAHSGYPQAGHVAPA